MGKKIKEKKNKLNNFIILSIIFHILLFYLIIFGSLNKFIKLSGNVQNTEVADIIMINSNDIIEQHKQFQQQQNNVNEAIIKQKKQQQQKEQKYLKMVKENNIKIKQEVKEQHLQAVEELVKNNIEKEKISKKVMYNKVKLEQESSIKEQIKTKSKIVKVINLLEDKKKKDKEKQVFSVNKLIDELSVQQQNQQIKGAIIAANQKENRKNKTFTSDVAIYATKIKIAIEKKFYDADIYRGKICELSIKLSPNGMLISIIPKNSTLNNQLLCDAAIRAAKTAIMPKPPSHSIYDEFNEQGSILVFNKI
ncbi:MAG: cell envelope integrity protein TolA [Arsenophonus sp. ET-DL9-MAG3]